MNKNGLAVGLAVAFVCCGMVAQAQVNSVSITDLDGYSEAKVDLESNMGMYYWKVGQQSYLTQQWFWYRNGTGGPNQGIHTLGLSSYALGGDSLAVIYQNSQLRVNITYVLNTAGPNSAGILESISVYNRTATPINGFSFFQYSNFDLSDADYVEIQASNGVDYDRAFQTGGLNVLSEEVDSGTIAVPYPTRYDAGGAVALLNLITGGGDLNNTLSYPENGAEDVAWAFQWTFNLAGGETKEIIKNKELWVTPVPEPTTGALALLGLAALALRRKS